MKHLLTMLFVAFLSCTAVVAQEKTSEKPTMSKEEKEAAKAKKESDLQDAFKAAGLSASEQQMYRTAMDDRGAYKKSLKADTSLSEDDFNAKYKEYSKDQDAKLKEAYGADKYKAFKDAQKAQREAMKAAQ
jgi:hypothetical protein